VVYGELLGQIEKSLRSNDEETAFGTLSTLQTSRPISFLDGLKWMQTHSAKQAPSNVASAEGSARQLHDSIHQSLKQLQALVDSAPCPILAIGGLLNAGKTSLVASFLSQAGRKRLLIGEANAEGTHRFVLWLPPRWRNDATIWAGVMAQLESVFECLPEELSDDPLAAFRQYNAADSKRSVVESFQIPLVAVDPALDRWNLGIMDCPDIQTGLPEASQAPNSNSRQAVEAIEATARERERIFRQAIHLASAFIVVTSANSLQDEYVDRLLDAAAEAMPGLHRILAVNRVPRRYSVNELARDVSLGYARHACWRTYMAYHFDGPHARERIPQAQDLFFEASIGEELPIFFRIDHDEANQPPARIPDRDFLVNLGFDLQPSRLSTGLILATLSNLRRSCHATMELAQRQRIEEQQRTARLQQLMVEVCLSVSTGGTDRNKTRLHVSREIVLQVASSLERTAPFWAKPSRALMRWTEDLKNMVGGMTQWFAFPSLVGSRVTASIDRLRSRWRAGDGADVISAGRFCDAVELLDHRGEFEAFVEPDRDKLNSRFHAAISRFQNESRTRLDDAQLDQFTTEMWHRMGWRQRLWTGLAPAGVLFAPLLAVVMLPMDFGGSSVLVFASMKELLVAGAVSAGLAIVKSDEMPKLAEQEAAWQQLSDLCAVTCDEFQLERPNYQELPMVMLDGTRKQLLPAMIDKLVSSIPLREKLQSLNEDFAAAVNQRFDAFERECRKAAS
jgi:hypothetical protein